jgi:hypothetical protein
MVEVNFSMRYENETIKSKFDTDENEALTNQTWNDLFENAIKQNIPYYVVGVTLSSNKYCNFYDGVTLYKYLKTHQLDPKTRLGILKVQYLFFKCFDFDKTPDKTKERSLPLLPISNPKWSYKKYLSDMAQDTTYAELLFDSLNQEGIIENDPYLRDKLAQTQFVIGSKLMNEKHVRAGIRWIWCAAQHQLPVAEKTIGKFSVLNHYQINLVSNLQEAEKWLELASQHGDAESKLLLDELEKDNLDLNPDSAAANGELPSDSDIEDIQLPPGSDIEDMDIGLDSERNGFEIESDSEMMSIGNEPDSDSDDEKRTETLDSSSV